MDLSNFQDFKGPKPLTPQEVKAMRKRLGLTQRLFAQFLGVGYSTVLAWEQALDKPNAAATKLLRVAERDPGILLEI